MNRKWLLSLASAAALCACASPAFASADEYIAKFCANGSCTNPTTERMAMRPTWDALTAGGTGAFLGGSIDGVRLEPATMVAGARVLGVPAFDVMLRTGQVPFAGLDARRAAIARMSAVQGIDINSAVGLPPANSRASAATRDLFGAPTVTTLAPPIVPGATGAVVIPAGVAPDAVQGINSPIPGAVSHNGCDAQIERMQIAGAAQNVNNASTTATSSAGFSRLDGQGAAQSMTNQIGNGGQPISGGGFNGMSCLSNMFNFSNLDIMFAPPLMSNMMSQITNMNCQQGIAAISALASPVSSAIFQTSGMGGFMPGMNLSAFAGNVNGAAQGNFTGVASLATLLSGGAVTAPPGRVLTMGQLYAH